MEVAQSAVSRHASKSVLRLPLASMLVSASIDETGCLEQVGGPLQKLRAYEQSGLTGPFLCCPPPGTSLPPAPGAPGSRWLLPGESLQGLLDGLLDVYRLDIDAIRQACQERSALTVADNAGYRLKYDETFFIRRAALDTMVDELLDGRAAPVMFLSAGSGQGKTCFLRNLHSRLARSPQTIPLLVRGVSAADQHLRLDAQIDHIARSLLGTGDWPAAGDGSPVDRLDRELQRCGVLCVVMLDGVNEADNSALVFQRANVFLSQRIAFALQSGRMTNFRLIVTSRPDRFDDWYPNNFIAAEVLTNLRPISKARVLHVAQLDGLNDAELDAALAALPGVGPVSGTLRTLLRDPLLLGFFRDTVAAMIRSGSKPPETPLELISLYWSGQEAQLATQAADCGLRLQDLLAEITLVCEQLVGSGDSQCAVQWKDNVQRMLLYEGMVFEEVQATRHGEVQVRFRYDRMAEWLIACRAVLADEHGRPRSDAGVAAVIVGLVLKASKSAALPERDVIRMSLVTALLWTLEHGEAERSFRLAVLLLQPRQPAYEDQHETVIQACQLALGEIVLAYLLDAAVWHGTDTVQLLERWFQTHPGDEASACARVLRRAVFEILRRNSLGSSANPLDTRLAKARQALHALGARALLTDASGDPSVLLHALYRDGEPQGALGILLESMVQATAPHRRLFDTDTLEQLQRVGRVMLLLAPEAIADDGFLKCVKKLFERLPSAVLAFLAAVLADRALNDNDMPVRSDQWETDAASVAHLREMVRLLESSGWEGAQRSGHASVRGALALTWQARNAYVTQGLSHALSARMATASAAEHDRLLDELAHEIDLLCSTDLRQIALWDPLACQVGTAAYLLSLVCYHLIVFNAQTGRVFDLMWRLADEVLLKPPFMGRFTHRAENGPSETSNIVGTLGRAAQMVGKTEEYRLFVSRKSALHRHPSGPLAPADAEFAEFMLLALATLGSLSPDPTLALQCICESAVAMGAGTFAAIRFNSEGGLDPSVLQAPNFESPAAMHALTALRQVRTIHPFAVEQFIVAHKGKRLAGPLLARVRDAAPAQLNRHTSWVFEHVIESVMVKHSAVVSLARQDMEANLTPQGLRVLAASSMLRLSVWARRGDKAPPLGFLKMCSARVLGHLAAASGPLIRRLDQRRKAQAAQARSSSTQ